MIYIHAHCKYGLLTAYIFNVLNIPIQYYLNTNIELKKDKTDNLYNYLNKILIPNSKINTQSSNTYHIYDKYNNKHHNSIIIQHTTKLQEIICIIFGQIKELAQANQDFINNNDARLKFIFQTISKIFSRECRQTELDAHFKRLTSTQTTLISWIIELLTCPEFNKLLNSQTITNQTVNDKSVYTKNMLRNKKMAICLFGFVRNFDANYKNHLQNILLLDTDIFIHSWNNTGYQNPSREKFNGQSWLNPNSKTLDQKDINIITECYKPKKILVEDNKLDQFSINDGNIIPLLKYQATDDATRYINSQLYSRYKVIELKKDYEKENNFKYDIVLLIRFDFNYSNINFDFINLDFTKTIYFPGKNGNHTHPLGGGGCILCDKNIEHKKHMNDLCDIMQLSNSENIDVLGDLYLYAKDILYNTRDKTYKYIQDKNITHEKKQNFIYVTYPKDSEIGDIVLYYPERLYREYLTDYKCKTTNHFSGGIRKY
jgi:hypothetical protein